MKDKERHGMDYIQKYIAPQDPEVAKAIELEEGRQEK
jgi:hypothetical protein